MAQTQIILNVDPVNNIFTINDAVPIASGTPSRVVSVSANYTASVLDQTIINTSTAGAAITVTLPPANTVTNKVFNIVNANATALGTITLSPAAKQDNSTNVSSIAIQSRLAVQSDGTNYWVIP